MLKWRLDLSLPLRQSTLQLKRMILANVYGVALPFQTKDGGVHHNAEMNILTPINYKEIVMKEDKLHDISNRDMKVWGYFIRTLAMGIAIYLTLELFA